MAICMSKSLTGFAGIVALVVIGLAGRLDAQVGLGLQIGFGPGGGVYVGPSIPFGPPPPLALYRSLRPGYGYYGAPRLSYQLMIPYPTPPVFPDRPYQSYERSQYNYTPYGYSQYGYFPSRQPIGDGYAGNPRSINPQVVSPNSPDLRPGMILPDGARVISVQPIQGTVVGGVANGTGAEELPSLVPEPVAPSGDRAVQRAAF